MEDADESEGVAEGERNERLIESRCDRLDRFSWIDDGSEAMLVVMRISSVKDLKCPYAQRSRSCPSSYSYSSPGTSGIVERGMLDAKGSAESSRSMWAEKAIS